MRWNTEELARGVLVIMVIYVAFSASLRAGSKPFWFDEIITIGLARQPTLGEIYHALEHAADSHPPPFYEVERFAGHLPLNEHIAYRLPSILAFCALILCIFVFISKARGSTCAVICAAILLGSLLFNQYAVEARGYSLMTAFLALAMVSYQRADKWTWCVAMGLALVAAEASHYYAVFAMVPFALGEVSFVSKMRRVRFGVLLALLFGTLPLVVFWPLLESCKRYYGSTYSSRPSVEGMVTAYGWLFNLPPTLGIGLAIAGLAAILIYGLLGRRPLCADRENEIPIQEHALALGFLALPVVTYLAAKVLAGGFNPRYLLPTVLGFPLAASYIVGALNRRLLGLFSILLLVSIGVQEAAFWRVEIHSLGKKMSPAEGVERLIDAAGHDDLPVVVSDALDYLQLVHYALPPESRRLTFVADGPAAITYAGSDSADKCLLALKPYLIFQIFEFADFARSHQKFLLYSNSRPKWDWWPTRLLHDGYKLELVVMDQEKRIYFVRKDP